MSAFKFTRRQSWLSAYESSLFKGYMEKELKIKAPDGKIIYCTLGLPKRKTNRIVIFAHGLASTEYWPTMLLGSRYFRQNSYAYCRINYYHWKNNARTLMSSDLKQHAKDTDIVVGYLKRKGYTNIFAVGHSFGGLTLMESKTSAFNAISLWDVSSFIEYNPMKWIKKYKNSENYYMTGSYELALSKRYIAGMRNFPDEIKLISKIKIPTQICYADGKQGLLIRSSKRYFENMACAKQLVAIKNASHSFTEEGVDKILFNKTKAWFDKY